MRPSTPTVAIVQKSLAHYRLPFFEHLRERLERRGIHLLLLYGQPTKKRRLRGDRVDLEWAHAVPSYSLRVGGQELYWQSCPPMLQHADLVVVEQASKLLLNYRLFLRHVLRKQKLAFWGHGRNLRDHAASRLGEAAKRYMSTRVHWWFAYNAMSRRMVSQLGFPEARITDVQNAIDTNALREAYQGVSDEHVAALRQELNLQGDDVCLYIGGMYTEKRLGFLLEACRLVKAQRRGFEMVFIGAGEQAALVQEASRRHDWLHYVGPRFNAERVPYFKMAKLLLLPGLVGLAILDAFCLETPLVTTGVPFHSPEIDYLKPGVNGFMVDRPDDAGAYAQAVVRLLEDEAKRQRLIEGGRVAGRRYTVEEMADRFSGGIEQALALGFDGVRSGEAR